MFQIFKVVVQIPALDRLMDYLDAAKQGEIDALTKQVQDLTLRLQQSNVGLQGAIDNKEKQ